jgi:tetratricopeptide (TPR) repeat protein
MRLGALVATLLFTVGLLAQAADDDAQVEQLSAQAKAAEARGDLAGAVEKYQSILTIDPRLGPAYNNLGALYVKAGEYAKAAAVLEKGLKVDPAMTSSSALLGISLFKIGKFAEARPRLEAALRASPANSGLELLLVNDLTKLGAFEAAEGHLQQLSRREPENQQVLYLLGKVYTQLAQQALGKMNAIDPNSVWAHEISAEIMESMKNYEGAVVEYKKAVEIAPHQPGIHYKLGDLYWSLSQWDNASEQFKVELVNDPGNCMAQWKIGDVLLRQSIRPEQALSDVNKALEMCPNLSEARLDRGRLLLKLHKEADALPDLQAAVKANPTEPGVHFSLAQAYRAVGKPQEAQAEMKVFAKLDASARAKTAEQAEQAIQNQETAH